ncbi:MAG: sugar transferase [Candidatus Latescibacterota bacterium]|nr:MAG: sugar transferase [Candidatus Latescibacterota bacterium]
MSTGQELEQRSSDAFVGANAGAPRHDDFELRRSVVYDVSKRVFDLVVSLIVLILLFPVIPVIAVMIRLDSPGPVFFRQDRVGKNGRVFKFLKFRSMFREAEEHRKDVESLNEQDGPVFKARSDPRITSVGGFLRRSSLDEIPQILNVVKGDMSIVGPRPPIPAEVEHYQPWQRRRLEVTPGITCLWQISGRSHLSFNEWMRLDMEYLKHRSFKTDLLIFLKTIPAVIARKGAY